jgi:hypothetical protein
VGKHLGDEMVKDGVDDLRDGLLTRIQNKRDAYAHLSQQLAR